MEAVLSSVTLVDVVGLIIILFYAVEGMSIGFILSSLDLLSFLTSFIFALSLYGFVARLFMYVFSMPKGFAQALGFFLLALITEVCINILLRTLYRKYGKPLTNEKVKRLEKYLGILPGIASAGIILAFLCSVIVSLPSSPYLKKQVTASHIGSFLISYTTIFEKRVNDIFGGALSDTLNFMTVEPKSTESVALHFTVKNGSVDELSEEEMLKDVNKERTSRGLEPLVMDSHLRELARSYSQDMFMNGYFSHYDKEGRSPFDRMELAEIIYGYAGENLALAPSTSLAMRGLMNSQGHKENILKKEFRKIGIGCIDGGIYGKMFTQEFTD